MNSGQVSLPGFFKCTVKASQSFLVQEMLSHRFFGWTHISKSADLCFVSHAYWTASACNIFIS